VHVACSPTPYAGTELDGAVRRVWVAGRQPGPGTGRLLVADVAGHTREPVASHA